MMAHQGLKNNWKQFTLLVFINAFVGGMIGIERSIFPQFAKTVFHIDSTTAILTFIIAFGISKAITNYFTGIWLKRWGRKNLLVIGWIIAIPVPILLIGAQSWNWVIFANILLGCSQGLTWSTTVIMKIDLVGETNRGLAMGLNEFAGYLSIALFAVITGSIASKIGVHPYPFYLGVILAFLGLLLSILYVKDTQQFVIKESSLSNQEKLKNVFIETTLTNKNLSAITQAGLVNNLNDGMIWGLLPILLYENLFNPTSIALIVAVYPAVWGFSQLLTGKMSDHLSKKKMLTFGMLLQGFAIILLPHFQTIFSIIIICIFLGIGTALVYPTFMVSIAQHTHPLQRAESIGTFRLWRDLGYAFGAILSGLIADFYSITFAIIFVGIITIISGVVLHFRMIE